MAFQTAEVARPILQRGPAPMPVVDRSLVMARPAAIVAPPLVAVPEKKRGRRPYVFVTVKAVKEMRERRAKGETLHMIARRLNCTTYTVRRHTADVPPPGGAWANGGRESKFCEIEARALRRQGKTYIEIAVELGCSETFAHFLINGRADRRRGVERPVTQAVEFVARATGIRGKSLRAPLRGTPVKRDADVSRARAILFWLCHQRAPDLNFARISRALGFSDTTIMDGVRKTERAIEIFGLKVGSHPGKLVRPLYRQSWQNVPCAK